MPTLVRQPQAIRLAPRLDTGVGNHLPRLGPGVREANQLLPGLRWTKIGGFPELVRSEWREPLRQVMRICGGRLPPPSPVDLTPALFQERGALYAVAGIEGVRQVLGHTISNGAASAYQWVRILLHDQHWDTPPPSLLLDTIAAVQAIAASVGDDARFVEVVVPTDPTGPIAAHSPRLHLGLGLRAGHLDHLIVGPARDAWQRVDRLKQSGLDFRDTRVSGLIPGPLREKDPVTRYLVTLDRQLLGLLTDCLTERLSRATTREDHLRLNWPIAHPIGWHEWSGLLDTLPSIRLYAQHHRRLFAQRDPARKYPAVSQFDYADHQDRLYQLHGHFLDSAENRH